MNSFLLEGKNVLKCPSCKKDCLYLRSDDKFCCDYEYKAFFDFQLLNKNVRMVK